MNRVLRGFPAAMLVLAGVAGIVVGVVLPAVASVNNGFGSGQLSFNFVALGLAIIVASVAVFWVALGVWRAKPMRTLVAMVLSFAMLAFLAWGLGRALNSTGYGSSVDPITGQLTPLPNVWAVAIAGLAAGYSIALACLVIGQLRQRRIQS
jgi:hypothetical protein